jgi:predicted metal-binding membrane protein
MGGLMLGLHHGAFCIGCCWLLMTVLFVGVWLIEPQSPRR